MIMIPVNVSVSATSKPSWFTAVPDTLMSYFIFFSVFFLILSLFSPPYLLLSTFFGHLGAFCLCVQFL